MEPRYLTFAHPMPVRGTLREAMRAESVLLNDLLKRFRAPRTGDLHRSRAMWEYGVLAEPPAGHTLSLIVYEEDGEPLGYVIYTTGPGSFPPPGPGQALDVREVVWLTSAAYRALWEHLARFDLVREVTWGTVRTIRCRTCCWSRACCAPPPAMASWRASWTWRAPYLPGPTPRRAPWSLRSWTISARGTPVAGAWRRRARRRSCTAPMRRRR
ncbi:MAG: hypothetical protein C4290_08430 [Chloroflexota bacterium]